MEIVQEMPQFERKVTFYPYSERKNDCNPPLMFSLKAVEAELLSLPHPPLPLPLHQSFSAALDAANYSPASLLSSDCGNRI